MDNEKILLALNHAFRELQKQKVRYQQQAAAMCDFPERAARWEARAKHMDDVLTEIVDAMDEIEGEG